MEIKLNKNTTVYNYCNPYIIAEIGANHNGDMMLAKKMIDAAVDCGCNAVKFQSWNEKSLVSEPEYSANTKYEDSAKKHFGSLKEMIHKYYLREEQHYELADYCKTRNVDFCSTPFSNDEVDLLNKLDVSYYKVASMDVNNLPFLKYIASFDKPIILSTGMASLGEIERAVNVIESCGNSKIVLLHCISIYPPENRDINLNNIVMLQQTFGYPVGFSDHTIGYSIPLASVALGACIIEKHFTTDKDLPGWDHEISANPEEMSIIVNESKNIHQSLGCYRRVVSQAEQQKRLKFRRSIVAARDMTLGDVITEEDIAYKRPGTGISPDELQYVLGKTLKRDIKYDDVIQRGDLA